MYDLGSERALRGGAEQRRRLSYEAVIGRGYKGAGGGGDAAYVRRRRLAVPMYEVRCTMYDLGSERALRGGAEQRRRLSYEAVIGRGYKGAGGGGDAAYVRCTIAKFARVARGNSASRFATVYDRRFGNLGLIRA